MNKPLLYLLLVSYSLLIFKPFVPGCADLLAHTFWYSHHMATVHFVNGKYHVHYEFAEAVKKNAHENNKGIPKNETPSTDQILFNEDGLYNSTAVLNIKYYPSPSSLKSVYINGEFPPPKC